MFLQIAFWNLIYPSDSYKQETRKELVMEAEMKWNLTERWNISDVCNNALGQLHQGVRKQEKIVMRRRYIELIYNWKNNTWWFRLKINAHVKGRDIGLRAKRPTLNWGIDNKGAPARILLMSYS